MVNFSESTTKISNNKDQNNFLLVQYNNKNNDVEKLFLGGFNKKFLVKDMS